MSRTSRETARRQPFQVAFGVLLRRPAALLIGLSLLILSALLIEAIADGTRTSRQEENIPSYEPSGGQLVFIEQWQKAMQNDQPDLSMRRLKLDFLGTQQVDGETRLLVEDIRPSANSDPDVAETGASKSLRTIIRKFPNTQWVSLREEHLASLPIEELNELADLNTIEFTTDTLTPEHLVGLSRFSKIQNLTVEAIWCNADLGDLAGLKNLRSLHLQTRYPQRGQNRDGDDQQEFMTLDHIMRLAAVPTLEELVIQDHGEFLNDAWLTGLTVDNKALYEQFVDVLRTFPSLKTLYIGRLAKPHGDKLCAKISKDLPELSIHPAAFDPSMAFSMGMVSLLLCLGLFVATSHLMTCNSLGQNCLLTGAREGHLKVYLMVAAVLLTLSALIVMLNTFAQWLPVITFELSAFALITALVMAPAPMQVPASGTKHPARQFIPLLFLPLTGFVVFAWMGNQFWGAHVANLFLGNFPLLCMVVTTSAVVLLVHNLYSFLDVHRLWAENGLPPAASWPEFQESFAIHSQQMIQVGLDAQQRHAGRPVADRWLNQLQILVSRARLRPTSWIPGCRVWLAAMMPAGMARTIIKFVVVWPIIMLWPLLLNFVTEGTFDATDLSQLSVLLMTGFLLMGIFIVMGWHGRQAMYATEILRPVRRSAWRKTVLSTMLATVGVMSVIVWGQIQLVRWLAEQDLVSAWNGLSFLSLLAAILFATGAFLTGLICRRLIFAAPLILIGLLAYVPVGLITIAQTSESTAVDLPSFPTLLIIIVVEFVVGGIILKAAWNRWARLELADL